MGIKNKIKKLFFHVKWWFKIRYEYQIGIDRAVLGGTIVVKKDLKYNKIKIVYSELNLDKKKEENNGK